MKLVTWFLIVIIVLFTTAGFFVHVWSTRTYELEVVVSSRIVAVRLIPKEVSAPAPKPKAFEDTRLAIRAEGLV